MLKPNELAIKALSEWSRELLWQRSIFFILLILFLSQVGINLEIYQIVNFII